MKVRVRVNTKGFTLIELIIVMAIFMVIIMISASAFESVMKISSGITKSAQSQMEGVVGLEILRKDLNAAGYALPWGFQVNPPDPTKYLEAYLEADNPVEGLSADDFNDAPASDTALLPLPTPPRAVVLGTVPMTSHKMISATASVKLTNPGSDYLVIKSAVVAFNNSVGRWGYVNYSGNQTSNQSYIAKWNSSEDFEDNDVVITLRNTFSATNQEQHVLAMEDATKFSYKLSTKNAAGNYTPPTVAPDDNTVYKPSGNLVDPFGAKINNEKLITYAIKSFSPSATDVRLRMPFNRADYFIRRPGDMSTRCNKGTGILYKMVITNSMTSSGGGYTLYPLLDCVGDMQVIFDLQGPAATVDALVNTDGTKMTAEQIRTRLKSIRVYLLVQEGGKDKDYSYPYTDVNNVISVSDKQDSSLGRVFSKTDMEAYFGAEWNKYRWKVYSVAGQPYNLLY